MNIISKNTYGIIAGGMALMLLGACSLTSSAPAASTTPTPTLSESPSPSPSPSATPTATATPVPTPTPSAIPTVQPTITPKVGPGNDGLPAFQCAEQTGGVAPVMPITPLDVKIGIHTGYDRFIIETNSAVPAWSVTPQSAPVFTMDGSGQSVTMLGTHGILVRLHGASPRGSGTWSQDIKNYPVIREARQVGSFEGVFSWGLGVEGSGCFRAFVLSSPAKVLVVDVQAP